MKNSNKHPSKIDLLARKMLNGSITAEEKEILEDWYTQNDNETPIWELKNESREQLKDRLYGTIVKKIPIAPASAVHLNIKYLAIAASLIIVFSVGLFLRFQHSTRDEVVKIVQASSHGTVTKIHLPDHTIVWLKGDSKLDFPTKFSDSTRNVTLHGEALFEVAKDKLHPFIIKTGNYSARVLGTSFNIRESIINHSFKLTVLTGKVAVSGNSGEKNSRLKQIIVTPGNEFEANALQKTHKISLAPVAEKNQILNGTEYDMNFENIPFDEVKKRIEKKFNVKINTGKNTYSNCYLSADVTDQSLENTLKVISAVINAAYKINKNQIDLTGGGCN